MLIPKGRIVLENHSTAYTQLAPLLADLEKDQFVGYVQLVAPQFEGILLLDGGNLVDAIVEGGQVPHTRGVAALEAIAARANERDGMISVHALPGQVVTALLDLAQSTPVHKDLDSQFASLDKLMDRLASNQHTGYVHIRLKGEGGSGLVYLRSGQPVSGFSYRDGALLDGPQALIDLLAAVDKSGASFDVYAEPAGPRTAARAPLGTGLGLPSCIRTWEEILARAEQVADGATTRGRFTSAWQRTLTEKARQYRFLDPFGKIFDYKEGHITYRGGIEPQFNQALSECLAAVVTLLAAEMPRANLTLKTKAALQMVRDKYPAAIQALAEEIKLDLLRMSLYEQVILEASPYLLDKAENFIGRQCREHLGVDPQNLTKAHLPELARRVEASARLFIAPDKTQALRRKIEALGENDTTRR